MSLLSRCLVAILLLLPAPALRAQTVPRPPVEAAVTPPMGWNSWDSYGLTVDEPQFLANAGVLSRRLLPLGWRYAVLDEGWFFANPLSRPHPEQLQYELDPNGRFLPVPARFPSSVPSPGSTAPRPTFRQDGQSTVMTGSSGLHALADTLHRQGLLFGLHVVRGIPRESVRLNLPIAGSPYTAQQAADTGDSCPWDPTMWGVRNNAAGQAWYDSLLQQYSGWGVDFLKVDCIADHPYRASEIQQIRRAIDRTANLRGGRPLVLSLSPGPTALAHAEEVRSLAQMWRISEDIWDVWSTDQPFPASVRGQFAKLDQWSRFAGPGHWPDADMLPVGRLAPRPDVGPGARNSRLSAAEQQTLMALWSMARSPLIAGTNLLELDDATAALLGNRDALRIDQTATASRQLAHEGDTVLWTADLPGGQHALAVFNLGDSELQWQPLDSSTLPFADGAALRESWSGTAWKPKTPFPIAPHGCALFVSW